MSKANIRRIIVVIIIAGGLAALGARLGMTHSRAALIIGVALAAIWGVGSVAVVRLSGGRPLLLAPALAVFVLSVVATVVSLSGHQRYLPIALINLAVASLLVRAALRHDLRRPD